MYNAGQSCCSVERIYVHEKIHDAFVAAFVATVKGYKVGDPMDESTYLGPLARAPQLAMLERQVDDAVAKGGTLLTGGKRIARAGNWFEATVLSDVNHAMELMREESFGPVIGIQRVGNDEEAVALMNDTEYGLTAGVYTPDGRARAILARVRSGSVYWNCCDRVSPRLPWCGWWGFVFGFGFGKFEYDVITLGSRSGNGYRGATRGNLGRGVSAVLGLATILDFRARPRYGASFIIGNAIEKRVRRALPRPHAVANPRSRSEARRSSIRSASRPSPTASRRCARTRSRRARARRH